MEGVMGRRKARNGRGNGAGPEIEPEDWFDEAIATMEVMRPLALTDSFPKFPATKRPDAVPNPEPDHMLKKNRDLLTHK
jgi:hypothetical protein